MFWIDFAKEKPTKAGWYLCTVTFGEEDMTQSYVIDLYWRPEQQRFIDNRRQFIFDTFEVRSCTGERLHTIDLCDRTDDVTAWMELPECYVKGEKKDNE